MSVDIGITGQRNLLKQIDWQVEANCFPRFSIIVGPVGSEKFKIAKYVAKKLCCFFFDAVDTRIETIRSIINDAYKTQAPIVYIINNADDMSIPAKNALLKVTEEPPNDAYFVMILEDINNTLDTIKSRATIFTMEPYSKDQLSNYFDSMYKATTAYKDIVLSLSETPGDIDLLQNIGGYVCEADKFYGYVAKVVDNIGEVNGANSFKIADKVALKDEADKYDLRMFWKACCELFHYKALHFNIADTYVANIEAMQATSDALKKLRIRGVNKQMLFDEWILNVREALR